MSMWRNREIVLIAIFISAATSYTIPDTLTAEQRLRIFGTNDSTNLPEYEVIPIELINNTYVNSFRMHLPATIQFRATIDDELVTLSLTPNRRFLAPGCLIHQYGQDGTKTLAPCFNGTRHCYYTGRSMNHKDSWVAASVCGGLKGVLVYGNTTLMISPLEETDFQDLTKVTNHVVVKYHGNKQTCSTKFPLGRVLYPTPKSRRRREEARRRYMEVSVVLDPSMISYHGTDLVQVTFISLNIASRLFADQLTGQDIELVITSIHNLITHQTFGMVGMEDFTDAHRLLDAFCEWKSTRNDSSLNTDAVIFLTKVGITNNEEIVTGLATTPRGMCSEDRNCAIIRDNGPAMGYTIAHEIGHLLSMKHDDNDDGTFGECEPSIMNAHGTTGREASRWSNCSKASLEQFLSSNDSHCLLNKPVGYDDLHGHEFEAPLPGVIYTSDDQCRFLFGAQASARQYNANSSCEQIVCKTSDNEGYFEYSVPILDGSDINNTRTWCIKGEPVAMTDADNTPPLHGGWSEWSAEWSTCTLTCGGGVKIRKRVCNNPKPRYAGASCSGSDVKAVICNVKVCQHDFKKPQCSELDDCLIEGYENGTLTSVPYRHERSTEDLSCKVHCFSPNKNAIIVKQNHADGTECRVMDNTVPFTRCIDGKCREFGCDGHLDSGLLFDECGRCNGTGADCKTTKGTYNRNGTVNEFETVLVLPKGSADIRINQTNAFCFLNILIDGEHVLNSSGCATSRVFMSHGIRIRYIKHPEHIRITGPLLLEVQIQVYRQYDYNTLPNVTPNIDYQYGEIISSHPSPYFWSVATTQCSKTCGLGLSVPNVICWGLTGPVEDHFCEIYKKPDETPQPCNIHLCPPKWDTTETSRCSVSCGNGTRNRSVECIQEKNNKHNVKLDTQCSNSTRPAETEDCNMGKCPSVWIPGNWSSCSKTCGDSIVTRDVHCYDYKNTSVRVPADECDEDNKPTMLEQCHLEPCRLDLVGANCTDLEKNCAAYGSLVCVGQDQKWVEVNCMKFCRICGCADSIDYCPQIEPKYCKHPDYSVYMKTKCEQYCGYC